MNDSARTNFDRAGAIAGSVIDSRAGELLAGRYRLKSVLGSGGMGDVYAAESLTLGRDVAVKILRAEHTREKTAVARFLREARAASRVNHINVVQIFDAGIDGDGVPFIVQELLSGEDLGTYLDRHGGRLGVEHALNLMRPVIDAIAIAHAHGVVHRDLKPENIFLANDDDGNPLPKVLDFGISKIIDEISPEDRTQTGVIVGTPHYMAPEQIIGSRELDGRVDVWALGVMLFELMTGQLPFGSRDDGRIFMRIALGEPARLETLVPTVSKDIARIVQRCLRRNIGERYPSAAELARDLKLADERRPIEPTQRMVAFDVGPAAIEPVTDPLQRARQSTVDISVSAALTLLEQPNVEPGSEHRTNVVHAASSREPAREAAAKSTPTESQGPTVAPIRRPDITIAAIAFLLAALVIASAAMRFASAAAPNAATAPARP